jgi:hypothetical protein
VTYRRAIGLAVERAIAGLARAHDMTEKTFHQRRPDPDVISAVLVAACVAPLIAACRVHSATLSSPASSV